METKDIIEIAKIVLIGAAAKKAGEFLGLIESNDQKKGNKGITEVLSGTGKLSIAFGTGTNSSFWSNKINSLINDFNSTNNIEYYNKALLLYNRLQNTIYINSINDKINRLMDAKGLLLDAPKEVKNVFDSITSLWEINLISAQFAAGAEQINSVVSVIPETLFKYLESFLNAEELNINAFNKIRTLPEIDI